MDFIERVAITAVKDWRERRIMLPSIVIAQAIKESARGTSELALQANALFGIKKNGWTGKVYVKEAVEQRPDGSYYTVDYTEWRAYGSWEESIIDHNTYIATRMIGNQIEPNWKKVVGCDNYILAIQYLQDAQYPYATSKTYAESLINDYIEKYDLTKYDKEGDYDMAYSNSSLVAFTKLSPNHSGTRTHSIDRITPHCVVGQLSAESIAGCFDDTSRQASCNYGIGSDGRVCLIVEEKNRSWCSSSKDNDQRAITIECASDKTTPYAMNSKVYESLVNLCVDICKRNGKTKLLWFGDKTKSLNYIPKADEMVITVHRWFANKSCPGDWLYSRLGDLAAEVTKKLNGTTEDKLYRVQVGAFRNKENAEKLLAELREKGYSGFIL